MNGRIEIGFAMNEGAVMRLLGLVERRGFEVCGISMAEATDGEAAIALDVRARDASRRLDIVAGQLQRLHDVRNVLCYQQGDAR
jgi:acetolactate synthase II small subunit